MELCIGLFGTCGGSTWREPFIQRYQQDGITFFNPQVEEWNDECAANEARHMANDNIILFPVTGETTGVGSLSEVAFAILGCLNRDDQRDVVVYIEKDLHPELLTTLDKAHEKDAYRPRKLVAAHLKEQRFANLYVVDSLEEMLEVSVALYRAAEARMPLQRFNPHRRPDALV